MCYSLDPEGAKGYPDQMKELVAALIVRDKKLLLVHNVKHGMVRIEPPGGKRHSGETREAAVAREAMEELGIEVRVKGLLCGHPTHSPEGGFIVHMFVCEITGGEPRVVEPDKIPSFGWYRIEDMEQMKEDGTLVPNRGGALEEVGRVVEGEESFVGRVKPAELSSVIWRVTARLTRLQTERE